MPLMSMRQYAKHRGVSAPAVSAAVKKGRIPCKWDAGGKAIIDSEVADRAWVRNTDFTKAPHLEAQAQAPVPPQPDPPADTAAEEKESKRPGVADAAAVLKTYQARLAKLDFEEKAGKLVSAEEVKMDAFKTARSVRDAMMAIPAKISAELAGETNPFTIHRALEKEIRIALENLSVSLEAEP
jgi:hypothetical protein